MEDAVKALLIAAGVMIGLMIISLGVTLFSELGQYVDGTQSRIEENGLQKYNEQFLKFVNGTDNPSSTETTFTLTIQDIVTAANLAYENNQKYGLTVADDFNYYVTVNMPGHLNLQNDIISSTIGATYLLKEDLNSNKKYICRPSDVKINTNTGRVCEINFTVIP